jgi:homoserine kinase
MLMNNLAAWRAISSDEIPSDITGLASSSDIRIALSDSGWLSCLSGAGCTLLWLPQERRGQAVAGFGSRFVIGAQSGAVTVLELPTEVA